MEDPRPDVPDTQIAPDAIPGYRIVRELGRGGMATVYLAVQESLGREVALKLLSRRLAEDPNAAERFVREARTAARLVHRHIVGIHDVGTAAVDDQVRQPYLAMEYLPGDTLSGGAINPRRALEVAKEIALALDHAHGQGVVHRDIKPDNILRRADGSSALADFGIARTADAGPGVTQEGVTLGTPHYMSPEQLQGQELDGRSDLYSLGVVLYQLLTGEVPYKGTDGWSVGVQHISAPLPRLPGDLSRYQGVVDALLAKDPARRPQTGADAAQLIDVALGNSVSSETQVMAPHASGAYPAASVSGEQRARRAEDRRAPRRTRLLAWAAGGVLLLALAGWLALHRPPSSGADAARATAPTAAAAASANRSIAVLPLANLSGNPANEYFSDGLAETMLDMLARVPDLKVIARTSSFAFKGKSMDVREIGRTLGAANLLEGSVQQSGEMVRISVQLIRASDGAHLWANKYDRKLADVFAIQDEVATEVVKALQVALPAATRQRLVEKRTENIEAYQEFLRGIALLPGRKVPEMRRAAAHFERAVALDPGYARAYVAARDAYTLLSQYASITPDEDARRQRYLDRALQLAPDMGEAHISRAATLERQGKLDDAEAEYQRGVELAPGYATGWQWYGEFEAYTRGRLERGIGLMDKAYALDPLSPIVRDVRLYTIGISGRVDEALALSDQLIADNPAIARNYDTRGALREQKGDIIGALRDLREQDRRDADSAFRAHRCHALIDIGALAEAAACSAVVAAKSPGGLEILYLHGRLALVEGKTQEAVAWFRRIPDLPPAARVMLPTLEGRPKQALAAVREFKPGLLAQPPSPIESADGILALAAGTALLQSGQREQGRAVIELAIASLRGRPRGAVQAGLGWIDVVGLARMGETERAFATLREGVDGGFFLLLPELDADPTLVAFRADPRYEQILAPARAKARQAVEQARGLGLL